MKRLLWPAVATLAAGTLLVLALYGERPGLSVNAPKPAGPMVGLSPAEIEEVEVSAGARRWRFVREGEKWRVAEATVAPPVDVTSRIDSALALLHDSAPERILTGDELAQQASFGLEPPSLRVVVNGASRFGIAFGTPNPLGFARYARIDGRTDVALMPGYVFDTWEAAVGLR